MRRIILSAGLLMSTRWCSVQMMGRESTKLLGPQYVRLSSILKTKYRVEVKSWAEYPKERMEKALEQLKTTSKEDHAKVKAMADIVKSPRSFIFKTSDDYDLKGWRDLAIPSDDDTPLEAWYIPAKGGERNKLIIFNHALPMCRAGFPGHFGEPWSNFEAVEIDFVIQYKHLTEAGYNVLTYDIHNHGNGSAANNGICGIGQWEWRDCVGVKKYVDNHPRLSEMTVGLYSQCVGGISQYTAIAKRPELFANVKCMCSPLVPSMTAIFQAFSELQGLRSIRSSSIWNC